VEADEKVVLLSEKIAALVAEAEQAGTQVTISPRVANPTIASYNASVVNFYNATGSLPRFENKNIIFYF
jgi:hypothetical protein